MSKCKGCPFWKWVRKDTLYDTRGFHYCEKNELTTCMKRNMSSIDSLPDENNPEPYNPVYDEDYLNGKIAKAKKSWEGVDVDKFMNEVRGSDEEPSEDLEEEIQNAIDKYPLNKEDMSEDDIATYHQGLIFGARHFAEWGARHSINWGDVQLLDTFILELSREEKDGTDWGDSEKFYTEVLRRFHEFNDKKIPEIVAEWEAKHKNSLHIPETCKENAKSFTSLEEAADDMALKAFPEKKSYSTVYERVVDYNAVDRKNYRDGIIAGAGWQREKMKKEEVEGEILKAINRYELEKKLNHEEGR